MINRFITHSLRIFDLGLIEENFSKTCFVSLKRNERAFNNNNKYISGFRRFTFPFIFVE